MSDTIKYGNDYCWCFIENNLSPREIAIWKYIGNDTYVVARAIDKYEAKQIVDALLALNNSTQGITLDKKALFFLEFVKSRCPEPYATMAANAILWNDQETYKKLLFDFPVIYS